MTRCLNASGGIEDVDLSRDRGFLIGDGVFETMMLRDGAVCWLSGHLGRLRHHLNAIDLPMPWEDAVVAAHLRSILPVEVGTYRLRLSVTAGEGGRGYLRPESPAPRLFVTWDPASPGVPIENLERSPFSVPNVWPAKTLSGLDRVLRAPPPGSQWVYVSEAGWLTECPMANIFWVRDGILETPRLNDALLEGLTRERVLAHADGLGLEVNRGNFPPEVLETADEIFSTGTVAGLVPVRHWEGRPLGEHPLRDRLARARDEDIAHEIEVWSQSSST